MRLEATNDTNVTIAIENGIGKATLPNGITFLFDVDKIDIITGRCWTYSWNKKYGIGYITDYRWTPLHRLILNNPKGSEIDHISTDTLDNRLCNLRVCTHQQNQCNQGLQRNNMSGVTGVSYYPPRRKYRARIKTTHHDIHLGYYETFVEAVQARNVGMECMFGEYGRYNDVPPAPEWIRSKVEAKCARFAHLAPKSRTLYEVA